MKADEKLAWIYEQLGRVDSAERALMAYKKQKVSDLDERLRKLKAISDMLYVKRTDSQQLELFDVRASLSPQDEALLTAPLHGHE